MPITTLDVSFNVTSGGNTQLGYWDPREDRIVMRRIQHHGALRKLVERADAHGLLDERSNLMKAATTVPERGLQATFWYALEKDLAWLFPRVFVYTHEPALREHTHIRLYLDLDWGIEENALLDDTITMFSIDHKNTPPS